MSTPIDRAIQRVEAVLDAPGTRARQIVSAARALVQLLTAKREAVAFEKPAAIAKRRIIIPDRDERWPGLYEEQPAQPPGETT